MSLKPVNSSCEYLQIFVECPECPQLNIVCICQTNHYKYSMYQVPTPAALETSPKPAPQSNRPKYNICKEKLKQKHFRFLHYDINSL